MFRGPDHIATRTVMVPEGNPLAVPPVLLANSTKSWRASMRSTRRCGAYCRGRSPAERPPRHQAFWKPTTDFAAREERGRSMDLLIDVRVTRRDSSATLDRTVRLRADPGGAVADLIAALLGLLDPAERPQQTTWAWLARTGRRLDPNRPLGDQGLRYGDTVLLAPPEQRPERPQRSEDHRFELLVLAGPDAGIWVPLPP